MLTKIVIQTPLPLPSADVWALLKQSRTLTAVTRGCLGFLDAANFPPEWQIDAEVRTRVALFHCWPRWWHKFVFRRIDAQKQELQTNEAGGLFRVWNHTMRVEPRAGGGATYTDEIEFDAGRWTWLARLWVQLYYRYRQWRWRRLSRNNGFGR